MAILTESQVASLKDEIRQQVKAAFEDKITDYIVGVVAVSEDDSFDDQDAPLTEAKDEEPKDDDETTEAIPILTTSDEDNKFSLKKPLEYPPPPPAPPTPRGDPKVPEFVAPTPPFPPPPVTSIITEPTSFCFTQVPPDVKVVILKS